MPEIRNANPDASIVLSIPEVARALGVGSKAVRGYVRERGLPTLQIGKGGRRVVSRTSLQKWLDENEVARPVKL
jgi:excisionase family DNA binding protein